MFSNFGFVGAAPTKPPGDVPPPTPVNLPKYEPQAQNEPDRDSDWTPLVSLLKGIIRPTDVTERHLKALGVHVIPDARIEDLVPDMSVVPDFAAWESLTYTEACDANQSTRVRISSGNLSPGVQAYHDRRRELSTPNHAAFRTVRRLHVAPGQPQARLGNSYEFFRLLESLSGFWDDTSASSSDLEFQQAVEGSQGDPPTAKFYRTGTGSQMPPEIRVNIANAFLKLVAYDFGCNVVAPRTEPRLYLNTPPLPTSKDATAAESSLPGKSTSATTVKATTSPTESSQPGPSSYFPSSCTFAFRTPTTREAARAGIVEGPLAAVSSRHTTSFPPLEAQGSASPNSSPDKESVMDLAREIVAALLTAQHRAREGCTERRVGENAWWATQRRWGGGEGGPIGREVDPNSATSTSAGTGSRSSSSSSSNNNSTRTAAALDMTANATPPPAEGTSAAATADSPSPIGVSLSSSKSGPVPALASTTYPGGRKSPHHHPVPSITSRGPRTKSRRTTLAIYDNYRMVRPPSYSWDRKARYSAIGRVPGADYDDVFVVSALFHHMSVLRVRVPQRLLEVLDGAPEGGAGCGRRSWGRLDVVRSPWFDMFLPDDRLAAMKTVWAMMSYLMRKVDDADVKMANT